MLLAAQTFDETKIFASDGALFDQFGNSVATDGNRIVVGSRVSDDKGSSSGSAYVYDWNGSNWVETKLTASDGISGDNFGESVSVSGNRILVGAPGDDDKGGSSGSAYVYDWNGSSWVETKLTASDGTSGDTVLATASRSSATALWLGL